MKSDIPAVLSGLSGWLRRKLVQRYWNGVFGELYGSAVHFSVRLRLEIRNVARPVARADGRWSELQSLLISPRRPTLATSWNQLAAIKRRSGTP